ncbi:MAG TPA: DotU family type IV/VI secretion system protein [Polyangiaceae bacterium]|jgi:type VI secretion system protein ImpK|nr:DotU family type IV/VI secretion system protein [Polyangiaceae bacterium]
MLRASRDVLSAAANLTIAQPSLPALRDSLIAQLKRFVTRARELGLPDAEIQEARYALVAFLDEQVLRGGGADRAEWMSHPLQLQFYRETTAGENFFARMRALTERGSHQGALEVYLLCIALGFVGAAPGGGGAQAARGFAMTARPKVLEGLNPARFAPNAIPVENRAAAERRLPVVAVMLGAAIVVCLVCLVSLQVVLASTIARSKADVAGATGVAAPKGSIAPPGEPGAP